MEDFYKVREFNTNQLETTINLGKITEKDKFLAAKQILLGLAILYIFTILAYLCKPGENDKLLSLCTTTFPPLATLILVAYFREKQNS